MLQWALRYRNLGLSVIPLRPNGKEPLIPWAEFQKRIASEEEIKKWFRITPNANIGIVTGAISGVVVVDLDGQEGIVSAEKLNLKSLTASLTGNGKHLWYKHPQQNVNNLVRFAPGIDLRSEGGYVVAPPSVHENGRRYRWLNAIGRDVELPNFPSHIFVSDTIQSSKNISDNMSPRNLVIPGFIAKNFKEQDWIAKALEGMKIGNIDNTLTSICGRLRHDGWSLSDARVLLQPHAERAGATPGHLEEKIQNVWNRYEPRIKPNIAAWSNTSSRSVLYNNAGSSEIGIHSPTNPDSVKRFEQSRLEILQSNRSRLLATGYFKLDQMLEGGLKSSRLFTVAARTGVGKTNWLLGAIRALCKSGKRVLLFSTEMPYEQIWQRYIAILDSPEEFKQHEFYVCDSFAPNLEKVEEAIKEIKPDVFAFDHINHVSEDVKSLGEFMQGLNYLRRKYDCAGIVTAQLNRSADWVDLKSGEKVTPRMSMIKGSGTIEQASSRVLLLSETRVKPECTEIVGNLDKNDNGIKGLVHFGLYNNPWRMEEL